MRVVIQRVREAHVTVAGEVTGRIGHGLLVLAGFSADESEADLDWTVQKIVKLRVFSDAAGVMNLDVLQAGGRILAVSQFTLYASTKKGNRPSWSRAARARSRSPVRTLRAEAGHGARPAGADRCLRCRHAGGADQRRAGDDHLDSQQPE